MDFSDHLRDLDQATADHLGDRVLWRPEGGTAAYELRILPVETAGQAVGIEGMSLNVERDAWQAQIVALDAASPGRRPKAGDEIEFLAGPRAGRRLQVCGAPRVEDAERAWLTFELG